jgi:hypothetical protein
MTMVQLSTKRSLVLRYFSIRLSTLIEAEVVESDSLIQTDVPVSDYQTHGQVMIVVERPFTIALTTTSNVNTFPSLAASNMVGIGLPIAAAVFHFLLMVLM